MSPVQPVLLAFVCNPDFENGMQLPLALNDALAASHYVPASIFGGSAPTKDIAARPAVDEDRTCTFERLSALLGEHRPRLFLFSGHADLGAPDSGLPKSLGFTQANGLLAPLEADAERVARRAAPTSNPYDLPPRHVTYSSPGSTLCKSHGSVPPALPQAAGRARQTAREAAAGGAQWLRKRSTRTEVP